MDYKEKYEKAVQTAILAKQNTESAVTIGILEEIFPELREGESEDEKIRKELIAIFKGQIPYTSGEDAKRYIAWLEKQGTPAKLSEEEQNRFAKGVLTSCAMSFIDYLDAHKHEGKMCVSNGECEDIENAFHNSMWDRLHRYYCKYIEKRGGTKDKLNTMLDDSLSRETKESWNKFLDKQKPVWSREDEQNLNAALGYINDEHLCRWLKDVIHAKYDKPAWSEEDERIALGVEQLCNCASLLNIAPDKIDEIRTWLKSLKERVQPQPKQEWCEEDERKINHIIAFMSDKERIKDTETMFPIEEDIRWLNSLKARYTWKPSDEQMVYLTAAIEESNYNLALESLYQDLKKLREK